MGMSKRVCGGHAEDSASQKTGHSRLQRVWGEMQVPF